MDILIVGGSGHLGGWLVRLARAGGHTVTATYATRRPPDGDGVQWLPVDLRVPGRIAEAVDTVRPAVVINASSGGADWAVTADGAARVAAAARARGRRLVHVSSDAVFSGTSVRYDEDSLPDPITPYGAAKAAAETAVRALDPSAAVARTSLIIGDGDSAHEELVRALATGRRRGMLFTDDIRCPVYAGDLAAALLEVAAGDHTGIVHLAGADALSRHELGMLIARRDGYDPGALPHGRRARTGAAALDVRLDGTRTQERLNTRLRGAREFLRPGR
ncbi:sugar nucleotide-binding protein [Streptosporangium sp. DT93]|uniref:sugar nucleotide-binding protein n=1 Tax=Streptosporangium sp. DT93 TaxID=3393428 RepID=UPI003CF12093